MGGEGTGTPIAPGAETGGNISKAMERVYRKIGTIFQRLSDGVSDYLDPEIVTYGPSVSQYQAIMQFIRRFETKQNTVFTNGDIVVDTLTNQKFLIGGMVMEHLLNQNMNVTGMLYQCNALCQLEREGGTRNDLTQEYTPSGAILYDEVYGCLVTQKIDLLSRDANLIQDDNRWFYTTDNYSIEPQDKLHVVGRSESYIVKTIDFVNLPGCQILQIQEDKT